jgi:uncharacterized protein (TIGR02246 family)
MARLFLSVAVLATGLTPATAQTKDPALDKLVADWSAAFGRGDAKALGSLYTDNAIRVSPDGGTVLGRAAIEKEFAGHFAGPWKGATIKILVGSVQPLGPDAAAAEGTYEVTPKGPDGKALPPVKGRYLNTMVKKNGAWMLSSNAAVIPAPPAR